jgi:putative peptidoglycan lipid II flippase
MSPAFLRQGLHLFLKKQTNILSAAFVIMATVVFSQILGLIRQRLLVGTYGASNELGVYLAASRLPDVLFQVIIAGALSSAFIPVFSEYLSKQDREGADLFASRLLIWGMAVFIVIGIALFFLADGAVRLIAPGFPHEQLVLMAQMMRLLLVAQLLFIVGSFYAALLQSHSQFFVPGVAAAMYNLGIIVGILWLHPFVGIYAPVYGTIIGAGLFVLTQLPVIRRVGFRFSFSFSFADKGVSEVVSLMWPRTLSLAIFQIGSLVTLAIISFMQDAGRNYVIFDYAQTLAFAPVVLFGQTIAQAAFPVLSRERTNLEAFKKTFLTSFTQMLYLILPIAVLFIVLRIPVVRLVYGASEFDWQATVLTGRTLALFGVGMFAQALTYLVARAFYALHDTKTPLIIGACTTLLMVGLGWVSIVVFQMDIGSLAFVYSVTGILQLMLLFEVLEKKVGGFDRSEMLKTLGKLTAATVLTGIALYIPLKLLDQLVFDTTRTIHLIALTGIVSIIGLSIYLLLTWVMRVKEAGIFLLVFRRIGNWKEILNKSDEVIDQTRLRA